MLKKSRDILVMSDLSSSCPEAEQPNYLFFRIKLPRTYIMVGIPKKWVHDACFNVKRNDKIIMQYKTLSELQKLTPQVYYDYS